MRLIDSENTTKLLKSFLSQSERRKVRGGMVANNCFHPSNPTGHYKFDLGNQEEAAMFRRLLELNADQVHYVRSKSGREDTSQQQNWSCFRNVILSDREEIIDSQWQVPPQGLLALDFVSQLRPSKFGKVLNPESFQTFCKALGLMLGTSLYGFENMQEDDEALVSQTVSIDTGGGSQTDDPPGHQQQGALQLTQSSSLDSQIGSSMPPESPDADMCYQKHLLQHGLYPEEYSIETWAAEKVQAVYRGGRGRSAFAVHWSSHATDVKRTRATARVMDKLFALREAVATATFTAQQAAYIVRCFPKELPSVQTEVAVALFGRILDLENFNKVQVQYCLTVCVFFTKHCRATQYSRTPSQVTQELGSSDRQALIHRLGVLNTMNPLKPDGPWCLRLTASDERIMASILVKLAVAEVGENWQNCTYDVPSDESAEELCDEAGKQFELDPEWINEVPHVGILKLTYSSDPGLGGLKPNWEVRKELQMRFLVGDKAAASLPIEHYISEWELKFGHQH